MHQDARNFCLNVDQQHSQPTPTTTLPSLQWDWATEHADRKRESKADVVFHGASPFEVDRRVLKDVVREKMGVEVGRITFLSAGTFHKAYLVTLVDYTELVARVARRFMPRLKTESEVATMSYLREKTNVPVPKVYHYDSNPYNRLGGEIILMSKAPGIPLSQVYHGLPYSDIVKLMRNLTAIVIPLFAHRFSGIGSIYFGPDPRIIVSSDTPTPKASQYCPAYSAFPFSPTLSMNGMNGPVPKTPSLQSIHTATHVFHVGPIISWPFFGSNRGDLTHPEELNRGPWASSASYLASCAEREIQGVRRENEGSAAPHRLHLDPDEIRSSRHHRLRAVPGDESDESEEWDLEESEEEWEGPGDAMYRDYRRMQRSTFLVAHMSQREDQVRREMGSWMRVMEHLMKVEDNRPIGEGREEFGLDCHDLSLENVFVDAKDNTTITCIIDWESTTTRPLWACAHVPAFLQSSPFVTKLFREAVARLPSDPASANLKLPPGSKADLTTLCKEWLHHESAGVRLRMAHRCVEWDGWEEGLVESILGPEEFEGEWFKGAASGKESACTEADADGETSRAVIASLCAENHHHHHHHPAPAKGGSRSNSFSHTSRTNGTIKGAKSNGVGAAGMTLTIPPARGAARLSRKLPFVEEQEKEQMLNTTGDICGGRGGELGRRLEAWLTVTGGEGGKRQQEYVEEVGAI
ncbi:hypothetical protein K443DRAFT_99499 [Laccaria amethystina LaAM-08-1]|uniref:Aminoglycoside phosphotransferase domain-containing protein n=1 Tax=Laccaria amethystina LaAM-08-1 TaxID=1095629 RepID=A0A0C9X7E0_9AGAR|nr:hypothetical protein K443DRAFT_99499 [Laccaria amethystina LaAM-08-1]